MRMTMHNVMNTPIPPLLEGGMVGADVGLSVWAIARSSIAVTQAAWKNKVAVEVLDMVISGRAAAVLSARSARLSAVLYRSHGCRTRSAD